MVSAVGALSPMMALAGAATLHLVGGPYVTVEGRRLDVPEGSKRLLVFVALSEGQMDRRYAAGTLWPDVEDSRAAGNLRSALWRMKASGIEVVQGDKTALWLRADTVVDVQVLRRWAQQLVDQPRPLWGGVGLDWCLEALQLLPGWYDEWVIFERERLRHWLLHALEATSRHLSGLGRHALAVDVALVAVRVDPLRESAQRALLLAHYVEGNLVEARRVHEQYERLLAKELGVAPSPGFAALVGRRSG